jgi:hypothetical protein
MTEPIKLANVWAWIQAALEAAQADGGDGEGTTTALPYRFIRVWVRATCGHLVLHVSTGNYEFSGSGVKQHVRFTTDGAEIIWTEGDIGIPTGSDWLPCDFVSWMKGTNEK